MSGPINATIRAYKMQTVKLEGATLEQVEAAAKADHPFNDELKAKIAEIAATGKRVHLMECPGTFFLTGKRVYDAFPSSREAFGWSFAQARTV